MLTQKQYELLMFIHARIKETGISPSFDEMKSALNLQSKSGIHRLVTALTDRGFIKRLPHRARALEIIKLPETMSRSLTSPSSSIPHHTTAPSQSSRNPTSDTATNAVDLKVTGKIAAGSPAEAIQEDRGAISVPTGILRSGAHYALEVDGDSMIEAGIFDGDTAIIQQTDTADSGDIVVAIVDHEATLKRLRRRGNMLALEAANHQYETRIFREDQVIIRGRLVGLIRKY